jgi:hypothetical protein
MWFERPDIKPEASVLTALRMAGAVDHGPRAGGSRYVKYDSRTFIRFHPIAILRAGDWPRVVLPAWKAALRAFYRGDLVFLPCRFDIVLVKNELILADFRSRSVTKCYRATTEDANDRGENVQEAANRELEGLKHAHARGIRAPAILGFRTGPLPMLRMEWKPRAAKPIANRKAGELPSLVFREADKLVESPRFAPAGEIASVQSAREVLESHKEIFASRPVLGRHVSQTLFLLNEGVLAEVLAHGDLSCNNVLMDADGVCLVDWENFGKSCLGYDILSFLSDVMEGGAMAGFVSLLISSEADRSLPSTAECFRMLAERREQTIRDCARDLACVNFLLHLAYMVRARKRNLVEVFLSKCERALAGWDAAFIEAEGTPK